MAFAEIFLVFSSTTFLKSSIIGLFQNSLAKLLGFRSGELFTDRATPKMVKLSPKC